MAGPVLWSDNRPRRQEVTVGDLKLELRELPMKKWEGWFEAILAGIADSGLLKQGLSGGINTEEFIPVILRTLKGNMRELVATSLDRKVNDKRVHAYLAQLAQEEGEPEPAIVPGCASTYANDELTPSQCVEVYEAIIDLHRIDELLGKFSALAKKAAKALGLEKLLAKAEAKTGTTTESDSPSTH